MFPKVALSTALAATFTCGIPAAAAVPHTKNTPNVTSVSSSPQGKSLSAWIPYWESSTSITDYTRVGTVMPFIYNAQRANGNVTVVKKTTQPAPSHPTIPNNVKIVPSVTDGTGKGFMAKTLTNPQTRTQHIQQLVTIADSYDGIDLDYETFAFTDGQTSWKTTQPSWAAFIKELAVELHKNNKTLSVTVPPSFPNNKGYWVYDYATLAEHADTVRIMAYDYSWGSPGPIAPQKWVDDIIAYATTIIPKEKLSIGVPSYGRGWAVKHTDACPSDAYKTFSFTSAKAATVLQQKNGDVEESTFDVESGEKTLQFTQKNAGGVKGCTVKWEAWWHDQQTLENKTRTITSQNLGVSFWTAAGVPSWDGVTNSVNTPKPVSSSPKKNRTKTLPYAVKVSYSKNVPLETNSKTYVTATLTKTASKQKYLFKRNAGKSQWRLQRKQTGGESSVWKTVKVKHGTQKKTVFPVRVEKPFAYRITYLPAKPWRSVSSEQFSVEVTPETKIVLSDAEGIITGSTSARNGSASLLKWDYVNRRWETIANTAIDGGVFTFPAETVKASASPANQDGGADTASFSPLVRVHVESGDNAFAVGESNYLIVG